MTGEPPGLWPTAFAVFTEIPRVLRIGGRFAVSFSNRCFPAEAVRICRSLDLRSQADLVDLYMARAGCDTTETEVVADGRGATPLVAVTGRGSPP